MTTGAASPCNATVDVLVVGAGFAGLYAVYRLRSLGLDVLALEAGEEVGGTWYWNRYPGARCDVESVQYSYSFSPELDQEWDWSERYATQPEILRYLNHVADKFGLRPHIKLSTTVKSATFDQPTSTWTVTTTTGDLFTAKYLVLASGGLTAAPQRPQLPGEDEFRGEIFHTASWPTGTELAGRRVGVVGTGSTGVQLITTIAPEVAELVVFQRTANFSLPARNRALTADELARIKRSYPQLRQAARESRNGMVLPESELSTRRPTEIQRDVLKAELERRWQLGGPGIVAFADVTLDQACNDVVAEWVREKIRQVVSATGFGETLVPRGYPIGTKRVCLDTGYFETYGRENVSLVDLKVEPVERLTTDGVLTAERHYPLDVLVFATGFDAVTGPILRMDIRGVDGASLRDRWAAGPRSYLGLSVSGFPNMFIVAGPGSPSSLTNVVVAIEHHMDWIGDCIEFLEKSGSAAIEAEEHAEEEWTRHLNEVAEATLFPKAASWYMGANIPGKPRTFMLYLGGMPKYREFCSTSAGHGYEGFKIVG